MSYKMSNEKNKELQEKASIDQEKGIKDTPSTWRGPADMLFGISQKQLDKQAEVYDANHAKCEKDRK